jgi:hypothetical protein
MANSNENGKLSTRELARAAMATVAELTGYKPEAVTGLRWDGEVWSVNVDALELARVPNTTDVLGCYEVQLDESGTLHGYRRVRRFSRAEGREED